jgi:glycine/D-amino acid oxidase-like deaminating enzyme
VQAALDVEEDEYRSLSFWHASAPGPIRARASLASDDQLDVAIVGAGYTGLWTAYYLKKLEPGIRVAIVESEIAGFGASGRNGGWCLGNMAGMETHFADPARRDGAIRLQRAMLETVDEVERVCSSEAIECHWAKSGYVSVATVDAHRAQLHDEVAHWHSLGFDEHDIRWLDPEECGRLVRTKTNLGGTFFAQCAAIHPFRLACGLADAVERQGVKIYERTPALALEPRCVVTPGGRLQADTIVRATEAYSKTLPGHERALLPLHSMMIATEPLSESIWEQIGLPNRVTFGDPRRMVIYGQRTADERLAFGARGAYFFRSGIRSRFSPDAPAFAQVQQILESLFDVAAEIKITHRWGGVLAVPRDWRPTVGVDRKAGFGWAGGYVGEGVAASNLAGRTLAELILERESERTGLPLVGPRSPSWEPEPLRWLGVSAVRRLGEALDTAELSGRPTPRLRSALFDAFVRK